MAGQPSTHRKYSREFKLSVVRPVARGEKSPTDICREHHLANSVLDRWRKEYDLLGEDAFQPRRRWLCSRAESEAEKEMGVTTMTVAVEGGRNGQDRIAQLERLCGSLALENFLLKQALQAVGLQITPVSVSV